MIIYSEPVIDNPTLIIVEIFVNSSTYRQSHSSRRRRSGPAGTKLNGPVLSSIAFAACGKIKLTITPGLNNLEDAACVDSAATFAGLQEKLNKHFRKPAGSDIRKQATGQTVYRKASIEGVIGDE